MWEADKHQMGATEMTTENRGVALRGIEQIFNHGSLTGLSEGQLLRRFAAGDEGAFEALIARNGPMVLGVCRRSLHDRCDVEDAFQATFLVLLRQAGALRDGERVGPWLHGVAYRVASRVRSRAVRRLAEEREGAQPEAVESTCDLERSELRGLLDEEIRRLPEKYRRPVVLCYLEGRTHEEAARRLRCSAGSVRGRLDRARQKLRDRLTRRGLAPAALLAALAAGGEAASAAVPASLVAATVATLARAATASAVTATASTSALELADGAFRAMFVARLKLTALAVVGILALGSLPLLVALEPRGRGITARQDPARPVAPASPRAPGDREQKITVTGRVLNLAGQPIADALVARGSDLRSNESIHAAKTDAAGRFAMPGVPRGALILTVQARGHAPDLKALTAGPGLLPVEFQLGPGHSIRGRIVDAHDKPIAGAPIGADEWRGHHSLRWSTRTDSDGRFRWDDAPADAVLIDLGTLGFSAKRFWSATANAPEKTIPMRRALHVRGRITDAGTGRPITAFTLVPGYTWEKIQNVWWKNEQAKELTGLSYDVNLSTEAGLGVVRIEAENYVPAISRGLKDDEEEPVVHFALHRGSSVSGIVRLPDGLPLAGAELLLSTPARPVQLNNGHPQVGLSDLRVVKTRADGRFTLPPSEPVYTIVVLHDRGHAELTVRAAPAVPAELTIQPWSRVEGILQFGRQPAAGQKLCLSHAGRRDSTDVVYQNGFATTDAAGRFNFNRVVPGEVTVSRVIEWNDPSIQSAGGSPSAVVEVAPAATVRMNLGGTGRPVVGKAAVPAEFAGREDWLYDFCYLIRKPPSIAPSRTAGKGAGPHADISFVFKVEPDGSFRIEDVEAGTYDLLVGVNKRPADQGGLGHESLASTRREVVVPAMPGGRSDEPLDLGRIPVTAVKTPEAAPSSPQP